MVRFFIALLIVLRILMKSLLMYAVCICYLDVMNLNKHNAELVSTISRVDKLDFQECAVCMLTPLPARQGRMVTHILHCDALVL